MRHNFRRPKDDFLQHCLDPLALGLMEDRGDGKNGRLQNIR